MKTLRKGWKFIDGLERHRSCPATFEIPSKADKAALTVGSFAKVGVITATDSPGLPEGLHGERFWVKLTHLRPFRGVVDNDLITPCGLKCGDEIQFAPRHILMVFDREEKHEQPRKS